MRTSNYGIIEQIKNVYYVIKSRILFKNVRMVRFPVFVRGKKYIDFGSNLTTGRYCRIEVNGIHSEKKLIFGENVNIGDYVSIRCANRISIGNNVLMGSRVLIIDNSHGKYTGENQDNPNTPPNQRELVTKPIKIEDNVWIGEGAVIQQGVSIGYGSIIAANSVVTKNIPEKCLVGGVPARILKKYSGESESWENYDSK